MLAHMHEFDMPTFMHQIREHKKTMAFHSIEEWGEWEGNNTFLKTAEAWEHINSFRLLDSYKAKPRTAASKADGDLLVITPLEQTLAPFKMLSHRLVEVLFSTQGRWSQRFCIFSYSFLGLALTFQTICPKYFYKSGRRPILNSCQLPKTFRSTP